MGTPDTGAKNSQTSEIEPRATEHVVYGHVVARSLGQVLTAWSRRLLGLPKRWAVTSCNRIDPHWHVRPDAMSFGDMAEITLNAIGDAVLVVDPDSNVVYLNSVAERMTGWRNTDAFGRPVEEVFHIVGGTSRERRPSPAQRAIREGRMAELALGSVLVRRDGTDLPIEDSAAPIFDKTGGMVGAVIVFHDASQSRSEIERAHYLAQHDTLTGLPNRLLLMDRLDQALGMARRHERQLALLFLDIDNFKRVNDSGGHAAGDALLRTAARDIVACVRSTDTVARIGGDEFVILLSQIQAKRDASRVAQKLLTRFATSRSSTERALSVTLSIGMSTFPEDGQDAEALIASGDRAMYTAKKAGRNRYARPRAGDR